MRQRNALTLVELLTVIAIIMLLVSIFLPSLYNVKQQANSIACRSNLRNGITFYPIELVFVNPDGISGRPTIVGKFQAWEQILENPDLNGSYGLNLWICDNRCASKICCYRHCWTIPSRSHQENRPQWMRRFRDY